MQELSDLSKKCLSNMPMMLDVILSTENELIKIFTPIYEDMKKYIEKELRSTKHYKVDEDNIEKGELYILTDSDGSLLPRFDLWYNIPFSRTSRGKSYRFEVIWGYLADEEQNVIYYQLLDTSDYPILDNSVKASILGKIPEGWKCDEEEQSIWIEFNIDDTLSVEKIKRCADDFKEYIVKPFISKLND